MTELRPFLLWNNLDQTNFDLVRYVLVRQSKSLRQSPCMRIDNNGGLPKCVGQNGVCRLATDAGKTEQIVNVLRDFPAKLVHEHCASFLNRARLLAEEADAADLFLQNRF